jgi:hypothetical protein
MKIADVKDTIKTARRNPGYPPIFLWGSPGIGKSQSVKQVAEEQGVELRDVRASLLDPTDLKGFPYISEGRMCWAPPSFLPTDGEGILFMDELNLAPQSVMSACYQLILDRRIGEYQLPEGWYIVAAGNPKGMGVQRMSKALINRFLHIQVEVHPEEWQQWAAQNGVHPMIQAFLRMRPQLLMPSDQDTKEGPYPTPRSWEFVSMAVKATWPKRPKIEVLEGLVGSAAAAEYDQFFTIYESGVFPHDILSGASYKLPEEQAVRYILLTACVMQATPEQMVNLLAFVNQLGQELQALFEALVQSRPDLMETKEYVAWLCKQK